MNRKTRRAHEKVGNKIATPAKSALTAPSGINFISDPAEYEKQTGLKLKAEGKNVEAAAHLRRALDLNNDFADAHLVLSIMAAQHPELCLDMAQINASIKDKPMLVASYNTIIEILKQNNQGEEAARCYEQLCILTPGNDGNMFQYGMLLLKIKRYADGLTWVARAINTNPKNLTAKALFTLIMQSVLVERYDPDIKKAISHCLDNIYEAHLRSVFPAWATTINLSPEYREFSLSRLIDTDDHFMQWMDQLPDIGTLGLRDDYILNGIRYLVMAEFHFERLMHRLRSYLCLSYDRLVNTGKMAQFEPLLCALAEQSYFNEFVMSQPVAEAEWIATHAKTLSDPATRQRPDFKTLCALVGCYVPLAHIFTDPDMLDDLCANDADFTRMIKTQVKDPHTEKSLWPTLPNFGALANDVSKIVQQQYEENPYPRWVGIALTHPPLTDWFTEADRLKPMNILVAGCGTGQQVIGTVARHPNSTFTAIDLSRASLAYAKRKATEAGIGDKINFVHADILSMADWPEKFDMIECSGVLHHMEDPMAGWTALTSRLKKGGYFKIGLYSEIARRNIVAGRDFVAQNNFPATVEGIRACRDMVVALPADNPMRQRLVSSGDFYTTSVVRDLIFHVQEHRMTLPQIKDMTETLGLEITRFDIVKPDIAAAYDTRFPGDPTRKNIDNWHKFEQDHPDTFITMYQFWCQKK